MWQINRNLDESYIFLNEKYTILSSMMEITFQGLEILKISGGTCPQTTQKKGTNGPSLILLVTLIKPSDYFNFY